MIAQPWVDPGATDVGEQPAQAWPGPSLAAAEPNHLGLSCLTVTGADATAVLDAATSANVLTPWVADGTRWRLTFGRSCLTSPAATTWAAPTDRARTDPPVATLRGSWVRLGQGRVW